MTRPFALIIEDDPKLGFIFDAALKQAGFETRLDAEGNHYQAILTSHDPELIILDLHLPFASGVEILSQLRADPQFSKTAIVVVTADLHFYRSLKDKGEEVLLKPVSVGRLLSIAQKVLAKKARELD